MKVQKNIVIVSKFDNEITFNGVGISGKLTSDIEFNLDYFFRILKRNKGTIKRENKLEVDEIYFRDIWYNDKIIKDITDKTIKFNEDTEKTKKFYRPKVKEHLDRTPIYAIKAYT